MPQSKQYINPNELELSSKVIKVKRVTKVVRGGRVLSFSALVVVGDKVSAVGVGLGKAKEVPLAVAKGANYARKSLLKVPILRGTLPHSISVKYKSSRVLLKPAAPGTGIIAGGPVRTVLEIAGIMDVVAKAQGANNPQNLVLATLKALAELRDSYTIAKQREISLEKVWHG